MAYRGATQDAIDEMSADQCIVVHLLELHWDEGVVRMTDFNRDLTTDAGVYIGFGSFLGFSDIEETAELITSSMTAQLSGVDQSVMAMLLSKHYLDRQMDLYKCFLNSAMTPIDDPVLMFSGRINKPAISEDPESGTCVISIEAASHWVDFERRGGRHTSHNEQRSRWNPNDKGFQYSDAVLSDIKWGIK
jgi:hypothetical protein